MVGEGGKVNFEFEARAAKKAAAPGAPGAPSAPRPPAEKPDLTKAAAVAVCPLCGGRVLETETQYLCEKSQAAKKPCKFRAGRTILGQPLDRAQLGRLLEDGRTDLLAGFTSKSGKPFSAFLALKDGGKVAFEFPDRGG